MTKLSGPFCVFQTLLPYLDLPDSTRYNKVESNVFRASVFHTILKKKETGKKCAFRDGMGLSLKHIINQQKSHQCIKLSENVVQNLPSNRISDFLIVYKSMKMMYCLHFFQSYFQVLKECKISY